MNEITIECKFGQYEVRAYGDFVCTTETFAEAVVEAEAYLNGGGRG